MRAMVFERDADKLVVTATAAEIAQFTTKAVVDVKQVLDPKHDWFARDVALLESQFWMPWKAVQAMGRIGAILTTACGCQRTQWAPLGQDTVVVPMSKLPIGLAVQHDTSIITRRVFRFREYIERVIPLGDVYPDYWDYCEPDRYTATGENLTHVRAAAFHEVV